MSVAVGCTPAGIVLDVWDMLAQYTTKYNPQDPEWRMQVELTAIGFIPVIGELKYTKYLDVVADVAQPLVKAVAENVDEATEAFNKGTKYMDDASNGLFFRTPSNDISAMSRHRGYHSTYNEFVKTQLDRIDGNQSVDVLQNQVYDLQQNLKYLQQSGLPLYPSQELCLFTKCS